MTKVLSSYKESLALRVSVIYIIVSLIYILFSDYIVTSIFSDIATIRAISTIKGWGFVLLSGLLIYFMIKRSLRISDDSEERFLLLADLTIEGIVLHKSGIVIDTNDAFTSLSGYKRKDVVGKNLIGFFINEGYRNICNENIINQSTAPYEVLAKRKNGQEIWIQIIGRPYIYHGKKVRVAAIRDITSQKNAEEKLRNNELFLRSIIENEPECIKILGPEGELRYMNPAGLKMIEVEDLELVKGKCVYPMILKEHRDAFIDLTNKVFKGEMGGLQFLMVGAKGTKLWLETKAVPLYDDKGNVESLLGITQNITERKKALDALKDNERMLSVIVDSTPLIIILLDADLNIIKINQTGTNLSERTDQQAKGLPLGQILNCIYAITYIEGCGKGSNCSTCMLRTSINRTLETHESLHKIEAKIFMGNNDNVFERNILISTEYIDIEGKPNVLVCIDDITERVQLEDVLREKTSILLKAQEMAKIGEFYYDVKKKIFRLSSSLEKQSGLNKSIISFDELIESIHPEDKKQVLKSFEIALAHSDRYSSQYRRIKPNGEIQHVFSQGEIERGIDGTPLKVFGVTMDVTEQKRFELELMLKNYELKAAEEELTATNDALRENLSSLEIAKIKAEESDRLKSAFLANMSHEIRTPMNAIMGFSDLLDMEDMPYEKRRVFTKTIKERTKDLLNIINDILDLSRIESHTLKIIQTKGSINNTLVEIKEFFEIRNEELYSKPIAFIVLNELTADQSFIETDFDRIKQIVINLVDNAFKFTLEGSIHLGCKLKDEHTLLFYVSDTGIGITKDKQQLIFERFRQADDSYLTREFGGSGLGLSICKGIIELLNGSIWVESELDKGSSFFFTIPYKPTNSKDGKSELLRSVKYDFKGKTILVVEDIIYNQEYLKEILTDTKALLLFADNGKTALDELRLHPEISIVLMDIRLPDINGLDLTKRMLDERKNIKVIAQTAYASSEDQSKCLSAGCVDFISKPISQSILLELLNRHLSN